MDSHALSAAATLALSGFKPLRNLSAGDEPAAGDAVAVGDAVGRVVGIGSPCADMQLRNASNADANPLKPPEPPKEGRSDAQASAAFRNVLLAPEPDPPKSPNPPNPLPGAPLGDDVGRLTPCCCRQLR